MYFYLVRTYFSNKLAKLYVFLCKINSVCTYLFPEGYVLSEFTVSSAGVGRTGTFITLGCMMPMIREQSLVDVYNFVNRMRDSRNRMVQVEVRY